jgi:hypothetical protein
VQDAGVEIYWLGEQEKEMEEEVCGDQDVAFGEQPEWKGVDESECCLRLHDVGVEK